MPLTAIEMAASPAKAAKSKSPRVNLILGDVARRTASGAAIMAPLTRELP